MMVDMTELDGKDFTCLEGCGMCCLCQPELTADELKIFETDQFLRNGLTREHVDGRRTAKPNAIKLQGDRGACHFLKNRLCSINELKPHFCRQFPVHVHVMKRIQLNVNLSCRGVTDGGNSLKAYAKNLISYIPENKLAEELAEARKVAGEFDQRCRNAGVYQGTERMREVVSKIIPIVKKEDGIAKLLSYADEQPEIGNTPDDEIILQIETTAPSGDIDQLARESNYDMFDLDEISKLPVYVDEKLQWIVFQSKDGKIRCSVLEEDGSMKSLANITIDELELMPRDDDALDIFADYARLLNIRDPFLGNAASICDLHEYKHDLLTVYLGVLGTSMLDLWWRASLVAKMNGKRKIDKTMAIEGIKAYDMDCLDAPTIGSFI